MAAAFWLEVTRRGRAVDAVDGLPGSANDPIEAHHVLPKSKLKQYARTHGLEEAALVWDPRNGMPVRRSRHDRHTRGFDRIPRADVPGSAVAFAEELGLDWVLDLQYR